MKKAIILIFVILLCSLVISSSVSRSVSSSIIEGSDLFVTLTATVTSPDTIIAIDETIPIGFSIVDANGGTSSQARHLQWINTEASGTIIYKYKVNVGNTPGTYTFSGKYVAENDTLEKTITGNTQVSVTALIPTCTNAHWTDTNGACQPNNTLTTTWTQTTTCQNGVQHTSPQTQSCNYSAPTCTDFNYSTWNACSPQGSQTRTITSGLPAGCQGGNPQLSQPCTYVPTCTNAHWTDTNGACQPNNTKTRTWEKTINCENGVDHNPLIETVACNYTAPVCATFTYSLFGECQQVSGITGTKSRTIATQLPTGCEGGTPDLTDPCTFTPTCTDSYWTYSLGTCDNNTQTKTWTKTADCNGGIQHPATENIFCSQNSPPVQYCGSDDWDSRIEPTTCPSTELQTRYWTKNKDCQGGLTKAPQETITCDFVEQDLPPTCTSFTYSDWSECSASGNQTRTILTQSPSTCTNGNPQLTQTCTPSTCTGTTCGNTCYTQTGICCNDNWNSGIDSCDYYIGNITTAVENSADEEAITLVDQAQASITNGEITKGRAEAQIALLKSKLSDSPELTTDYENALFALNEGNYEEAEQLAIEALASQSTANLGIDFNDPLTQIVGVLLILTIIVIIIIVLGSKKGPKQKKPTSKQKKDPLISEREALLKNLRDEFK